MKQGWLWQVSVAISPDAEEAVAELLSGIFSQSASIYVEAETQATLATVYVQNRCGGSGVKRAKLKAGLDQIKRCGIDLGPGTIFVRKLRRKQWAESWKRHFKPMDLGPALLIKPSWSRRQPKRNQAVMVLDPGLSFGTGQHPTTRFCLDQLVAFRQRDRKQSFLDLGTGSGILAIAAAKLGYRPVHALDLDPQAVRVARTNTKRNRVSGTVRLICQDLTQLPVTSAHKYSLICANLIYDLLLSEKGRILGRLNPKGTLVLAGVLRSQFTALRQAYEWEGMRLVARRVENEWASGAFVVG